MADISGHSPQAGILSLDLIDILNTPIQECCTALFRTDHNLTEEEIIKYQEQEYRGGGTNVKRSTKAVVGGISLGTIFYYGWRWYQGLRRIRNCHLTNEDLNYSDRSVEELVSAHLIDLNGASVEQISELGISAGLAERLLEIVRIAIN